MNSLGNEVTIKVKEAIREKLKEMKANSSDEIIDYIMLLVTTKKTTAELAKSIDFVMENNTNVFVKWLSTIIKRLQQVTVSTTENDVPVSKESKTAYKEHQAVDDLVGEKSEKLNDFDPVQENCMFDLCAHEQNLQIVNETKHQNSSSEISKSEFNKNQISPPVKMNRIKEKISFFPTKIDKDKNIKQINKQNLNEKCLDKVKNNSEMYSSCAAVSKQAIYKNNENINHKNKRPRISIYNDDEDRKNTRVRLPITFNETPKLVNKQQPKKNIHKSTSQIVKTKESEKNTSQDEKKLFVRDLTAPRVDHQRGALALDTAFKYIQQQVGASDKDILVMKKWRDYAVEMLRSYKKA